MSTNCSVSPELSFQELNSVLIVILPDPRPIVPVVERDAVAHELKSLLVKLEVVLETSDILHRDCVPYHFDIALFEVCQSVCGGHEANMWLFSLKDLVVVVEKAYGDLVALQSLRVPRYISQLWVHTYVHGSPSKESMFLYVGAEINIASYQ